MYAMKCIIEIEESYFRATLFSQNFYASYMVCKMYFSLNSSKNADVKDLGIQIRFHPIVKGFHHCYFRKFEQ